MADDLTDVFRTLARGKDWPDLIVRPAWHADAACRGDDPADWCRDQPSAEHIERLAAICAGCPVLDECRDEAAELPHDDVSFRAGEDHRARRARRRTAAGGDRKRSPERPDNWPTGPVVSKRRRTDAA